MIRLGIIGTGGMANWHAKAASELKGVKLAACCDIREPVVKTFAEKWLVPKSYIDYREMLEHEKLDAVVNVTPDAAHADVAIAVLTRGIPILSEKPLATSLDEAIRMAAVARDSRVPHMVNFSYRNSCGLQRAAEVIRAGKIGRIIHVESSYLQSWLVSGAWGNWLEKPSMVWRLSSRHGSAGVLGDLGCHIYDLATLLCGDIAEIDCRLAVFQKVGITGNTWGEYVFDANDSFVSTVLFKNGAIGTIHSSRWAIGQGNSLRARVYGDKGAIELDLDSSYDQYKICTGKDNINGCTWQVVECKPTPSNWQRFVKAVRTGRNDVSDFFNGTRIQAYLHYSFESDKLRQPVKVELPVGMKDE